MVSGLVFASRNPGKVTEMAALFRDICPITSLIDLGMVEDIPETGNTLKENAWIKASTVFQKTGKDCFADDTGLLVEALAGRPGVHSARYAGEQAGALENNFKLLKEMEGIAQRSAAFVTVICLCLEGQFYYFEGRMEGELLMELRGNKGFGYDPLFVPLGHQKTLAEMSLEEKNLISHRGKALLLLKEFLVKD